MRGKAVAALRHEHVVGEHVLACDLPVRLDILRRNDAIGIDTRLNSLAPRNQVEAIHLPVIVTVSPQTSSARG